MVATMLLLRGALVSLVSDAVVVAVVAPVGAATYLLALRLGAERYMGEMLGYLSGASPTLDRIFSWRPLWRAHAVGGSDG